MPLVAPCPPQRKLCTLEGMMADMKRLEKRIAESEREAGGNLGDLQDAEAAAAAAMAAKDK